MNEIILQNNQMDVEIEKKIVKIEKQMAKLKAEQDALRKMLLDEMEKRNLIKVETDKLVISYVAPTDRESFDSKQFRTDNPDLYDKYVKISPVKSSVRVKVK